ncbi:FAD-binding protein [Romboutsia ilealis]|uniref:FAD binding domain-containing protein n=1 Tax=Romboutsia faecis TaxID=2764597 RepID=A0ABR7JPQ9_9FIRM|nr:FAD binding domain-containing protein [Romboutsia faecis]MBC5996884.1 FAD binding domain-containing protein [Romboutsia faecis]MRN24612.1 FAD-binding protein [Romboutsia ilealis]
MFTVMDIVQPTTVEEAYSILTKRKNNQVIGGSAWLRMGSKRIGTAVELSQLNLDYIKEEEEYIEIGAMTTFRSLETSEVIESNFGSIIKDSVKDIIGVQFRNVVTVGGTIFSKFGFSDLIVALLALGTEVELVNAGRIKLCDFLNKEYEKDLLTKIYIKKNDVKATYKSLRNAQSDYALLNVSVSKYDNKLEIYVGARPQIATLAVKASEFLSNNELSDENIEKASQIVSEELAFGTNMRASKEYRTLMSKVLVKRALMEVK